MRAKKKKIGKLVAKVKLVHVNHHECLHINSDRSLPTIAGQLIGDDYKEIDVRLCHACTALMEEDINCQAVVINP